jgi:hypothetical protein
MGLKMDLTWRPVKEQTAITSTASSQQSAAVGAQTWCVRLGVYSATSTYGVHYSVGNNPTATGNSPFINAGQVEYVEVGPGDKIAILWHTGASTVTITEMDH